MDDSKLDQLKTKIGDHHFQTLAELQTHLEDLAVKQKVSGRWIALVAVLVGVTYLAFQDLITILVVSVLIVAGVTYLLRRESREVKMLLLSDDEAAELFESLKEEDHEE